MIDTMFLSLCDRAHFEIIQIWRPRRIGNILCRSSTRIWWTLTQPSVKLAHSVHWLVWPTEGIHDKQHFKLFSDEVFDLSIYDLPLFGPISSRKQDLAVVATLFGIMGRALCRKNGDCWCSEFKAIRQGLNSLQIENMAESSNFPAVLPETPLSTPAEIGPNICLFVCYLFVWAGQQENEEFVRETVSSPLLTVAEKQGDRRAFRSFLKENIYDEYFSTIGVPGWIQLYVKLATKLPNRSWHGKPFWIFLTSAEAG